MSIIRKFSRILQNHNNLSGVYSAIVIIVIVIGLLSLPQISLHENQLYQKEIDQTSGLNPYDRGGVPFEQVAIGAQYPDNLKNIGYVTAYLSPFAILLSEVSLNFGTTICAHPGGIIDEILYNTRGLDTIVETSILFTAFAIAMFLYRRREE